MTKMSDICKNATSYLQKKFGRAPVSAQENSFDDLEGGFAFKIWPMIAFDPESGVKQRAIAINNLGSKDELHAIAQSIKTLFAKMDSAMVVEMGNDINKTGQNINNIQMPFAPRVLLYTDKLCVSIEQVIQVFEYYKISIEVVTESEMHKTLFISYGGPDEEIVSLINKKIKNKGVKTWFFPDDALPGEKLHRVMHEGVNNHDRVLLVCSKDSLSRNGVLNEIERALEREAREGGSEILIPITLDEFVYSNWARERTDIAEQIRSRVIAKMPCSNNEVDDKSILKIVSVLKN